MIFLGILVLSISDRNNHSMDSRPRQCRRERIASIPIDRNRHWRPVPMARQYRQGTGIPRRSGFGSELTSPLVDNDADVVCESCLEFGSRSALEIVIQREKSDHMAGLAGADGYSVDLGCSSAPAIPN